MNDRMKLADKLDAHSVRYANDYGYNVATDLKAAAAALRAPEADAGAVAELLVLADLVETETRPERFVKDWNVIGAALRRYASPSGAEAGMRERAALAVRNKICTIHWPPEDGDELIDCLMAVVRALPLSPDAAPPRS